MADEKKVKEEKVKLHNKGKREFTLTGGIKSPPGRAIDVDKSVAEKFITAYPKDFMLYEDLVAPSSTKQELKEATAKATALEDENAKLKAQLEALKTPTPAATAASATTIGAKVSTQAKGATQSATAAKGAK